MIEVLLPAVVISFLVGFALSAVGTRFIRKVALERDFVDLPGGHKRHAEPVALGGGIAITTALIVPILAGLAVLHLLVSNGEAAKWLPEAVRIHIPGLLSKSNTALAIVVGAVLLHILGLIDDKRPLGPWLKLIVQVVVAGMIAVVFDVRLMTVMGYIPSVIATVLWIVLITNAFNFLDNMDGLCAGVAAITASIFAVSAIRADQIFVPTLALLVVGIMLGFLYYNFPPAKIFMGDAGSLVTGFILAVLTILTTYVDPQQQQTAPVGWLLPIIVLAVPLYDTISVMWIRIQQGINPLRGDQRHFSHRLVQRGMSPTGAVMTIYLATAATSLSATLLPKASWPLAILVLAQCLCIVFIIAVLEQVKANDQT